MLTQVTVAYAYQHSPQGGEARTVLPGLLASLGEPGLPLTRLAFGDGDTQQMARWAADMPQNASMPPLQREVLAEIAAEIRRTADTHSLR